MIFVDTNYFLRYLHDDVPEQSEIAKKLFLDGASDKKDLFSSTLVFFEIFWVIDRSYKYDKEEALRILHSVLAMNFVYFEEREILVNSLKIYKETSLELEDCYNLAYAKENDVKEFKTFDKKILKFIKR